MPQLHETITGRRFFEKQLPDLINGINRIADCLEEKNKEYKKEYTCFNCGETPISPKIITDSLGGFIVCEKCGANYDANGEGLLSKNVYNLCAEDVKDVLEDMGHSSIVNDEAAFRSMLAYVKDKLDIPWSEYVEAVIELKLNIDKE